MLELEVGSITNYLVNKAGNVKLYTDTVPANFFVPAIYIPEPVEVDPDIDTLYTYNLKYMLKVKIFHKTTQDAYAIGTRVVNELLAERNRIPLLEIDGTKTGMYFKVICEQLQKVDQGVVNIDIKWDSRRFYNDVSKVNI